VLQSKWLIDHVWKELDQRFPLGFQFHPYQVSRYIGRIASNRRIPGCYLATVAG
jgi:hypothetical protein